MPDVDYWCRYAIDYYFFVAMPFYCLIAMMPRSICLRRDMLYAMIFDIIYRCHADMPIWCWCAHYYFITFRWLLFSCHFHYHYYAVIFIIFRHYFLYLRYWLFSSTLLLLLSLFIDYIFDIISSLYYRYCFFHYYYYWCFFTLSFHFHIFFSFSIFSSSHISLRLFFSFITFFHFISSFSMCCCRRCLRLMHEYDAAAIAAMMLMPRDILCYAARSDAASAQERAFMMIFRHDARRRHTRCLLTRCYDAIFLMLFMMPLFYADAADIAMPCLMITFFHSFFHSFSFRHITLIHYYCIIDAIDFAIDAISLPFSLIITIIFADAFFRFRLLFFIIIDIFLSFTFHFHFFQYFIIIIDYWLIFHIFVTPLFSLLSFLHICHFSLRHYYFIFLLSLLPLFQY